MAEVAEAESEKSIPAPVRATVCVVPCTASLLSVMVRVPLRVPAPVGVKVTLMAQSLPAATDSMQLSVAAKSPVLETSEMLSGHAPALSNVIYCGELVVPTTCGPKVRRLGNSPEIGTTSNLKIVPNVLTPPAQVVP